MKKLLGFSLVVWLLFLTSCAATKHAKNVEPSGFLSPDIYLMLKDGNEEELEATKRFMAENVDWKTYTKIMLDPIVLFSGPVDKKKGISQEDKQHLLDYFFNKAYKAIEESPYLEHATQPGVPRRLARAHLRTGGQVSAAARVVRLVDRGGRLQALSPALCRLLLQPRRPVEPRRGHQLQKPGLPARCGRLRRSPRSFDAKRRQLRRMRADIRFRLGTQRRDLLDAGVIGDGRCRIGDLMVPVLIERMRDLLDDRPGHQHVEITEVVLLAQSIIGVTHVPSANNRDPIVRHEQLVVHTPVQLPESQQEFSPRT